MTIYFKVRAKERNEVLDKEGQRMALGSIIMLFCIIFGCVIFFIVSPGWYIVLIEYVAAVILLAFVLYVLFMSRALIGSVYRQKNSVAKDLYIKHKDYFDKKFAKMNREAAVIVDEVEESVDDSGSEVDDG